MSKDGYCSIDINQRLRKTGEACEELNKMWRLKVIDKKTKCVCLMWLHIHIIIEGFYNKGPYLKYATLGQWFLGNRHSIWSVTWRVVVSW